MSYKLHLGNQTYSRKFATNAVHLHVDFNENWSDITPRNITVQLENVFSSIIRDIGNYLHCDPSDQVRFSVGHPGLKSPAWISFRQWSTVKAEDLLNPIAKILQSNEEFRLDERLSLHVCHVKVPDGAGQGGNRVTKGNSSSLADYLKRKRAIVVVKNKDDLCFQRALVLAKHYAIKTDTHEWEAERTRLVKNGGPKSWQTKCVYRLIREVGARVEACRGLVTWELYQKTLAQQGYQLFVYAKSLCGKLLFKGKVSGTPKKLRLYHHDEHYDVITSMPAFYERSYYCDICEQGYNNKEDHKCTSVCGACRRYGPDCATQTARSCPKCFRTFFNENCFRAHRIAANVNAVTVCDKWKKCVSCGKEWDTRRKGRSLTQHVCGEYKCRVCKEFHSKGDRWCYIQSLEVDKTRIEERQAKEVTRFVFYDFECQQHTGEHIPNLCVLQLCCHFCIGQTNAPCMHCDSSWNHQKEVIFSGQDTLDNVAQFFVHLAAKNVAPGGSISTESTRIVAVAHNFRGYDGMLILQGIYKYCMEVPSVILNGGKVMTIKLGCLKFVDSLNFLSMPLRDLPKTFGIDQLRKGYFPHFFNIPENASYIGSIPDAIMYDPDGMSVGERKKFHEWYQDQRSEIFNFQKELLAYCQSDVDILRKGCGAFRTLFMADTGIDPFSDSLTLPSACNKVFRAHYMQPNTIVIIPRALMEAPAPGEDWKRFQPRQQSNKALRWLEWEQHQKLRNALGQNQPIPNIRHARNGGEVKVGPYSLDGYDTTDQIAYEFHGCCYHGCGTCYPGPVQDLKHYHPYDPSRTMRDLNRHTADRIEKLKTYGLVRIEVMWECEFDRQRLQNTEMDEFITGLELRGWPCPDPLMPRNAFFGGRTNAIQLMAEPRVAGEEIRYVDVVSLYPYICKYGNFPIQEPTIITQPQLDKWREYEGLIQCKVLPPQNLYHPVLPYRNQKLTFPLCRTCVQEQMQKDDIAVYRACHHEDKDRSWVGTFVSLELAKAVEVGYRILDIYEVWHWDQWSQYDPDTKTGGLFTDYINHYLKMKMESSGYPENCRTDEDKQRFIDYVFEKEGIRLEADNIMLNKGKRAFAKAILNYLWGKFGQRDNFSQTVYVTDPSEYFRTMSDASEIIKDVQIVNENMVLVEKIKKDQHVQPCDITNVVIAAFVTAQARLKLYSVLEPLGDRVCYFDTDSVIYRHQKFGWNPAEGSSLGEWKNELPENEYIEQFVAGGPKNYAYRLSNGETVCKVRGFTLNYRGSQQLNFDTVKSMVLHLAEKASVRVDNPHKIVRSRDRTLRTRPESKIYKPVFTKRMVILDDEGTPVNTLPYGYLE